MATIVDENKIHWPFILPEADCLVGFFLLKKIRPIKTNLCVLCDLCGELKN
jgi:hypothetical protein